MSDEELELFKWPAFSAVSYGAHCAQKLGFIPRFDCFAGEEISPGVYKKSEAGAKSRETRLNAHVAISIAIERNRDEWARLQDRLVPELSQAERNGLDARIRSLDAEFEKLQKKSPAELTALAVALTEEEKRNCANPNNFGNCKQKNRIGHLYGIDRGGKIIEDVSIAFICHYAGKREDHKNGTTAQDFFDVALLQTNRKTGETCWYQNFKIHNGKELIPPFTPAMIDEARTGNSKKIALDRSANETRRAEELWVKPIVYSSLSYMGCANCHDGDALIHSAHINGKTDGGIYPSSVLPIESDRAKVPYSHLAPGIIPITGNELGWQRKHVRVLPEGGSYSKDGRELCSNCHRIGRGYTCNKLIDEVDWENDQFKPHFHLRNIAQFPLALAAQRACCNAANLKFPNFTGVFSAQFAQEINGVSSVNCELLRVPKNFDELNSQQVVKGR